MASPIPLPCGFVVKKAEKIWSAFDRSQEKRLRDVVETIPAMTFTALSDGRNTFVNKRWTEYAGFSVEQSSGGGWQRAIHADDLARHSEKWRTSVASGELFEDEARFRRAAEGNLPLWGCQFYFKSGHLLARLRKRGFRPQR